MVIDERGSVSVGSSSLKPSERVIEAVAILSSKYQRNDSSELSMRDFYSYKPLSSSAEFVKKTFDQLGVAVIQLPPF